MASTGDDLVPSAARELLADAVKHAQARSLRVKLSRRDGTIATVEFRPST